MGDFVAKSANKAIRALGSECSRSKNIEPDNPCFQIDVALNKAFIAFLPASSDYMKSNI